MNPSIFRKYDIRGIIGKDLSIKDAQLIGKGFGTYLRNHNFSKLTVGHDCRLTSKDITDNLIKGLISTGCDVINIGVCTSPILYYSIINLKQEGGVMVTASHNPPAYNGFKLCVGASADSLFGDNLLKVYEIIKNEAFACGSGTLKNENIIDSYKNFIKSKINLNKKLKVGIDAGNGTAGVIALPLLKELNCDVYDIYCDMDGTFPNHTADPTVLKNMKDLIKLVKKNNLDVGIGYDGDGDRLGVIDEKGNIIYGDKLMIIFSREILSRKPGSKFISEVKCSKVMYDDIEKNGGIAIMGKTGHSIIKKKLKEENAELAGEMSGHMFFCDRYLGFDDAIYATCRLLEILSNTEKKLSELLSDVPKTYSTPEIRVKCPDDKKFGVVEKITSYLKSKYDVIDIDGARVLFDDGWGLVRASNTEPSLVLRFEAMTENRLEEIRKIIESKLNELI